MMGHERLGSIEVLASVLATLTALKHLELQFRGDRVLEQRAMIKLLSTLPGLTALAVSGGELLGAQTKEQEQFRVFVVALYCVKSKYCISGAPVTRKLDLTTVIFMQEEV